jgi:hypothetical protein
MSCPPKPTKPVYADGSRIGINQKKLDVFDELLAPNAE